MNFALFLLAVSVMTGAIYLLDLFVLAKKRKHGKKPPRWVEYARSFFPIFFTVLLVRSFVLEPFRIPSGSLEPTLLVGDFLIVNKFIYGLRLPVFEKKVLSKTYEDKDVDVEISYNDGTWRFIIEFKKRNFKIDFTGHDIILHDNYSSSYFYNLFN